MDFKFSREQLAIKKAMKQFAEERVEPYAAEIDETSTVPEHIVDGMREMGLFGICFGKEWGGAGGSHLDLVVAMEELAKASAGVEIITGAHYLSTTAIEAYGSKAQKEKYMHKLCKGELIGSFAFTEATTGSNPRDITTTAVKKEDGMYHINGAKRFITNPERRGPIIVFAKTENGGSAFLLDKFCKGYSISQCWHKMGCRGAGLHDVYFDDVIVSEEDMIGKEGQGYQILLSIIGSGGKPGVLAMLTGIAEAALEEATKYAQERKAYGKPIAKLFAIQELIANSYAKLQACKMLLYRFAYLMDNPGERSVEFEASMAKLFIGENAREIVNNCLQVHSAYGYISDFKVERLYRDVRLGEVVEGASELQKVIVGKGLLRK